MANNEELKEIENENTEAIETELVEVNTDVTPEPEESNNAAAYAVAGVGGAALIGGTVYLIKKYGPAGKAWLNNKREKHKAKKLAKAAQFCAANGLTGDDYNQIAADVALKQIPEKKTEEKPAEAKPEKKDKK